MQQIVSRLNTGLQRGMLPPQPGVAQLRRTTLNRNKIGSTHKALPRTRRASEKARAAERCEHVQTDNAFITTSTAGILAYYHVSRVGVIKRVSQLTDPFG
jgi:hypothetical protein